MTPPSPSSPPRNLEQLLDRLRETGKGGREVSLGEVMDTVGHSSFGPALLVAGLITLAPLVGDIPGVPTIMGALVFLVAGQLLLGRTQFWLPRWMLNRRIEHRKLCR